MLLNFLQSASKIGAVQVQVHDATETITDDGRLVFNYSITRTCLASIQQAKSKAFNEQSNLQFEQHDSVIYLPHRLKTKRNDEIRSRIIRGDKKYVVLDLLADYLELGNYCKYHIREVQNDG